MQRHAFPAGRAGDLAEAAKDVHRCRGCADRSTGPSVQGSGDVALNGKPVLRTGDIGLHSPGCRAYRWAASKGSATVLINHRSAFRMGDPTKHSGGSGNLVQGSANVLIGDAGAPRTKRLTLAGLLAGGATFAFQAPSGLASMLGGALGESIPWLLAKGLPGAIFKLLKKTMKPWVEMFTDILAVGIWIAWHTVKIRGKLCVEWARWFFTNHIDNLLDGGPRHAFDHCPVPEEVQPIVPEYPDLPALHDVASVLKESGEPTQEQLKTLHDILRYFQPIEYQYDDDLYPISLGSILKHSIVVIGSDEKELSESIEIPILQECKGHVGDGKDDYIDIDDDFARGHVFQKSYPSCVYGSASYVKEEESFKDVPKGPQIKLSYQHLRASSYLPTKEIHEDAFCHEGDHETADVIVDVATGRIVRTNTGGHGYDVECYSVIYEVYEGDPFDALIPGRRRPPSRPVIFIAHGSHAIASTPGKREARHGEGGNWAGGVTDWHPPQQSGDGVDRFLPALITEKDGDQYSLKIDILEPLHLGAPSKCK